MYGAHTLQNNWRISINQASSTVECGVEQDPMEKTISMSIVNNHLYQFLHEPNKDQVDVIIYELTLSNTNVDTLDVSNGARFTLDRMDADLAEAIKELMKQIGHDMMRIHVAICFSAELNQILFHVFMRNVVKGTYYALTDYPNGEATLFEGQWQYAMRMAVISGTDSIYVMSSMYAKDYSQFMIKQFSDSQKSATGYYLCVTNQPLTLQRSKKQCTSAKESHEILAHVQYGYTSQSITVPVYLYLIATATKTVWI
ncbi:hypothetical protein BLA29_007611, partial [Euroglyphus maynei]